MTITDLIAIRSLLLAYHGELETRPLRVRAARIQRVRESLGAVEAEMQRLSDRRAYAPTEYADTQWIGLPALVAPVADTVWQEAA